MSASLAWIALSQIPQVSLRMMRALETHFGTLDAVFSASALELQAVRGIGRQIAQAITSLKLEAFRHELEAWQAQGVRVVLHGEADYPAALLSLDSAPASLFVLSEHWERLKWDKLLAIVGTRSASTHALNLAHALAGAAVERGYVVVSGLAWGVDTAAHKGALNANGQTLAVLGGGILKPYPPLNRPLAELIAASGALICETAPNAEVSAPQLVARNRLISALARQVVLVEADSDGGALHTVRFGLEQGRPVWALDTPATGNQRALQQGAQPLPASASLAELLARLAL